MSRAVRHVVLALALLLPWAVACGDEPTPTPPHATTTPPAAVGGAEDAGKTVQVSLADRPFALHVPKSYAPATKAPLVVLLHGYRASAADQESYFGLTAQSDERGFLYAMPDGTKDRNGDRFWNATDACCNFYGSTVDDSAYVADVIATVKARYAVDAARVYLVGHSNGGFMAYRFACDHADQIAAIVSLAGAMWSDLSRCAPARPVTVLQIHGTSDQSIKFAGGSEPTGVAYPSAATTLADWRGFDGCSDAADTSGKPKDLVTDLAGAETTVTTYARGCRAGTRVELWTIKDGAHVPRLGTAFPAAVVDFLYATTSN